MKQHSAHTKVKVYSTVQGSSTTGVEDTKQLPSDLGLTSSIASSKLTPSAALPLLCNSALPVVCIFNACFCAPCG